MSVRVALAVIALALPCGALAACTHRAAIDEHTSDARTDTLAGTVAVTGSAFDEHIVLRAPGGRVVELTTSAWDSTALVRLGGTEIAIRGRDDGKRFLVVAYTVRSVDGSAVSDGTLRRDGDHLLLLTDTGLQPLGNPPVALRRMIGARVWVGGSLATGPNTYGLISPAPLQ